ncbi:MAG: hypothetical protein HQL20_05420, partial [Candidatus Omnitrophica bacterium]|nr:hypothetical protein [Candidatus Omnitrophota bacterium]
PGANGPAGQIKPQRVIKARLNPTGTFNAAQNTNPSDAAAVDKKGDNTQLVSSVKLFDGLLIEKAEYLGILRGIKSASFIETRHTRPPLPGGNDIGSAFGYRIPLEQVAPGIRPDVLSAILFEYVHPGVSRRYKNAYDNSKFEAPGLLYQFFLYLDPYTNTPVISQSDTTYTMQGLEVAYAHFIQWIDREIAKYDASGSTVPVAGAVARAGKAETTDASSRYLATAAAVEAEEAARNAEVAAIWKKFLATDVGASFSLYSKSTGFSGGLAGNLEGVKSQYNKANIGLAEARASEIKSRLAEAEKRGEEAINKIATPVLKDKIRNRINRKSFMSVMPDEFKEHLPGYIDRFIVMVSRMIAGSDGVLADRQIVILVGQFAQAAWDGKNNYRQYNNYETRKRDFFEYLNDLLNEAHWAARKTQMLKRLIVEDVDKQIARQALSKTWFAHTDKGRALLAHVKEVEVSIDGRSLASVLKAVRDVVGKRFNQVAKDYRASTRSSAGAGDDAANADVDHAGQAPARASALTAAEEFVRKLWEESGKSLTGRGAVSDNFDRMAQVVLAAWLAGDQEEFKRNKEFLFSSMGHGKTPDGTFISTKTGTVFVENSVGPAEVARLFLEMASDELHDSVYDRSLYIPYAFVWSILGASVKDTQNAIRPLLEEKYKDPKMSPLKLTALMLMGAIRMRAKQKGSAQQAVSGGSDVSNSLRLWTQALSDPRSGNNEEVAAAVSVSAALLGGTPEALELAFAIRYELNDHFVGNMHLPMNVINMLTVAAALHGGYQSSLREVLDVFSAVPNRWGKDMPIEKLAALVWGRIIFERNIRYRVSNNEIVLPGGAIISYPDMIVSREGEHFGIFSEASRGQILNAIAKGEGSFTVNYSSFGGIYYGAESQDFPLMMEVESRDNEKLVLRLAAGWEEKVNQYREARNAELLAAQGSAEPVGEKAHGDDSAIVRPALVLTPGEMTPPREAGDSMYQYVGSIETNRVWRLTAIASNSSVVREATVAGKGAVQVDFHLRGKLGPDGGGMTITLGLKRVDDGNLAVWELTPDWKERVAKLDDYAASDASSKQDGGIDLNAIDVNRTGEVNAKVFDDAAMATMLKDVTGFRPVILNIAPVTNLRLLLGMAAEDAAPTPATPAPLAFIRPAKEHEES